MKIHHLFIILLFVIWQPTIAQNQNNNWCFGDKAGLTFSNGNPQAFTSSQMTSIEGCASVSDPVTDKLLFYSNGLQVWDANNNAMPNGNGLLAGPSTSSTQGVFITPYPGNAKLFYLFTTDETSNGGANGIRYSVVDMGLNNGLGDVISSQKNILVRTNTTERIAATTNANGTGYWIIIHERNNNRFKAYSITASGFNTQPVITSIGSVHSTAPQANGDGTMGYMKFSPDGKRLAVAIYATNLVEWFDFDNASGSLSNAISISTLDNPYGLEFSPDNSKLYYSMYYNAGFNGAVYQLDLSAANPSPQLFGLSSSINNQCMGALQLAPDNKIYISINSESWLSAIAQPNNVGVSCGFVDKAILLPNVGLFPTKGILGLPPKVLDIASNAVDTSKNYCSLYFPNAFTPNGDGKNDKFSSTANCPVEHFELLIFNKWGELIYKTNNQKDQWDGTYLGLDCPNGVYIYISKYNFFQQPQKEQNGPLMLLR